MTQLICWAATYADIAALSLEGHPFLHEQGEVVLRGFVQTLDVSEEAWSLCARDIEELQKYAGVWSREPRDTYGGLNKYTSFRHCGVEARSESEKSVQISCHGSLFHIGARVEDPWRDNLWPELDTDFLTSDMATSNWRWIGVPPA